MNKNIALLALTGVLTLASCGTGPGTDQPSGPVVTTRTLTVNLGGGVTQAPITVSNGTTSNTYTVTNGQVIPNLASGTYTVTAGSVNGYTAPNTQTVNLTSGNGTVTLTYSPVQVVPPTPGTNSITITSPTQGANATVGQAIQVNYTTSAALTNVTCTVAAGGTTSTPANASNSSSGGFCTVTPTAAGSNTITVTGTDAQGRTVTQQVVVNAVAAQTSTPSNIVFDPAQELTLTSEGIVRDAMNGWRRIGQGVSTPTAPDTNVDVYVKGTINVTYRGAAAGQKVDIILARTTGTDVPSNDQIQAGDVLRSVVSTGADVTAVYDSRRLAEFEAVRQWLVFRVNGTVVSFQPVITDNRGPEQPDPEFNGVSNAFSNLLRNFQGSGINYARGDINVFTTNPSLQDREFGQAPLGASFVQRRPAGFESIRYYLVPETAFNNKGLADSDEMRRAEAIKQAATIRTAPILEPGDRAAAFNSLIGSGSQTAATVRALDNINYRIYAISRDQLGNETASASFETIRFDNVGPSFTGSVLRDVSDLPFPSLTPEVCLSDIASVNLGGFADNAGGIGFATGTNAPTFTIGGIVLNPNGVAATTFDTNRLADGNYRVLSSNFTDALGNPPANNVENPLVTIDNTDPTANFNRPVNLGVVESGERVSVEARTSDTGCGVHEVRLFWDSNTTGATDATTLPTIGHPVQFARSATSTTRQETLNLNAGWNALQVPNLRSTVQLRALVVDRAGNATIASTPLTIEAKGLTGAQLPGGTNTSRPTLGNSDGYRVGEAINLAANTNLIAPVAANGTTLIPNFGGNSLLNNRLSLSSVGTFTTNSGGPTNSENIREVSDYGRFDNTLWTTIRNYVLTNDPTLTTNRNLDAGQLRTQRAQNWNVRAPWIYITDSTTPDNKQLYTADSDLLNDYYWFRTFGTTDRPTPVFDAGVDVRNTTFAPIRFTYDQFNKIVADTAGAYSFLGEEVQR
ncbi:hypothetical protein L1280_002168 [Deinococcus sp. HSC-46F16]|uniref:beta strand repeat-containing protein n=1 Tax=Deinococcus sp. HSC-46F16 TaxID=2910968 RepID=UPI0020A14473|nr:hypothetical protein [Deinococcus sp. HSC-46F16]MCP2015016.1 hypothetical protein [Deinococcus sp. HSC-46F16]